MKPYNYLHVFFIIIIIIYLLSLLTKSFFFKNPNLNIPIYYINMDKHTKRNNFMKRQLKYINYKRVPGIEFNKQNKYKIDVKSKFKNKVLKDSEIACTLAHLNTIEQFLKDKHDYALICEDDANFELQNYWPYSLKDIIRNLNNKDINWTTCMIYHNYNLNNKKGLKKVVEEDNLYGTVAYLISRNYALKIKQMTKNFTIFRNDINTDPRADYFLYYNKHSNPYINIPALINLNINTTSSIHFEHDDDNYKVSNMIKEYIKS
jgi:GR25 family glycosyltransferase involved in LPS biosynthesis